MSVRQVILNLLSVEAKLLPAVNEISLQPSSSSTPVECHQIENELKELIRLLQWIKALSDAEEREIGDRALKRWLQWLREVAYDAEDVLDEFYYEVLRAQVEARDASSSISRKIEQIQVPPGMLHQIQIIRKEFSEIENDRLELQISEEYGPRGINSHFHYVVKNDIVGQEREKEKLIGLLSSQSHDGKIISVVTIVGMGGTGKTTLAQLVYNDQRIQQKFDKIGWVYVPDDFNVQRVTANVVESMTQEPCFLTNLSALQEYISDLIREKRVFLVLDDVWNEDISLWELFQKPFMSASSVKILVTARNESVAQIMQTMPTFKLGYLSEEQCWQIFQHYAFGEVSQNIGPNLVEIGRKIMKKCLKLPFVIKCIAIRLRYEKDEESWDMFLKSDLWEVQDEIFLPLQISYTHLPAYMKPCFLYCSIFPKNYHHRADDLVKLWMSQGYVQDKLIGWECAKLLQLKSFFDGKYEDKYFNFTLFDMVHTLAQSISGQEHYSIAGDMVPDFPHRLYHLYVGDGVKLVEPPPVPSQKFDSLRTLIIDDYHAEKFLRAYDFSKAQKLRALQLGSRVDDVELYFPSVNLKHLRYLSLNGGHFERLPEFICSLYYLQNLTLENCPFLIELPQGMGNLISLEELLIIGCKRLRVLHVSLCQLKALRKLLFCECRKYYY
ncbi:Disease resistance protein (CC-NBS-LRR class) family [Rhynchospora pubera]|uniref:Disease resistance protein (CC-NBS-LRR class) family n=1 Tax=Rhynchospora pubera TaxID=906938 RepID=A0AAV8BW52_9POAL|nr:Disease resistance protein (CC-NBS-LRR class) family [Rhynchospora pubera]